VRVLLANPRHAVLRRLLALAVVLLPVPGSAFSLMSPPSAAHCGERVCKCAHHCPMSRKPAAGTAAKPSCHEEAPSASRFWQQGPCGAAQGSAEAPPPVRPHVAEGTFTVATFAPSASLPPPPRGEPASGFLDRLLLPPRTNA
jgi:hypothetical protein